MQLGRSDSKVLPLVCLTSLPARHRTWSEQFQWEDSRKSNEGVQHTTGGGLDESARANVRHSADSLELSQEVSVSSVSLFWGGVGMVTQLGPRYHLQTNRMK